MTLSLIHSVVMDTLPPRYVRARLPGRLHEDLRHLTITLHRPIPALLEEAVTLLVRYYQGDDAPMVRERTTRTRGPK